MTDPNGFYITLCEEADEYLKDEIAWGAHRGRSPFLLRIV